MSQGSSLEPSRSRSIAGWIASILFGTYAGAWAFATVSAFLRGGVLRWLLLMAVASALAAIQAFVLGAVDVVLLWAKMRALPRGRAAWLGSVGAAAIVGVAATAWPFARWSSPLGFVSSLFVPMLVASFGVRLFLGERP